MAVIREARGGRPKARDLAMRVLYEADITGDNALEIIELGFGRFRFTEDGRAYAERLVRQSVQHHRKIDNAICKRLENWDLNRLGALERAILRLATAEILFFRDTPVEVILDEALRLGHRYGDEGAPAFLNGVLDPIAHGERRSKC
ncbi:MAG: transcription antitermination factor NusB [Candidatus Eisenbacteria sp.]|nr:transcription antitermination factor NusB [Candidatus Eisenbacteria bacterium]